MMMIIQCVSCLLSNTSWEIFYDIHSVVISECYISFRQLKWSILIFHMRYLVLLNVPVQVGYSSDLAGLNGLIVFQRCHCLGWNSIFNWYFGLRWFDRSWCLLIRYSGGVFGCRYLQILKAGFMRIWLSSHVLSLNTIGYCKFFDWDLTIGCYVGMRYIQILWVSELVFDNQLICSDEILDNSSWYLDVIWTMR